jgi:prepilin-type N-terminal cleavage/methylation domain-containing protein
MRRQQQQTWRRRQGGANRRRRGFTLMEVMITLFLLVGMGLMFGAVIPLQARSAHISNTYNQASLLCQHKIDQLRGAGFGSLNFAGLLNRGIIDDTSAAGLISSPYRFTVTDQLAADAGAATGFFPAGSTGTIDVRDYSAINASTPAGQLAYVTVTVRWTTTTGTTRSCTAATLISQAPYP